MTRAPNFDHLDVSTPAGDWRALIDTLPAVDPVGGHDHLLVVAAHPDDETLGAGGLVADAAAAGAQVTVLVATDGEASHPRSSTHTAPELARLRAVEVRDAVRELAPYATVLRLELPDGELPAHREPLARSLADAAADATVIACPWREDGHPDHDVCGQLAVGLAAGSGLRVLEYPVWGWHWGQPGTTGPGLGPGWVTRPMSASARRAKSAALATYVSQHRPLSPRPGDEAILSPALLENFTSAVEVFRAGDAADLPGRYFDRLYRHSDDPWALAQGFYERRKRELLLGALPRPRFARAFEPGCALGLTTVALAERCDHLVAWDVSPAAVAATFARVADRANVEVAQGGVPQDYPDGRFDLVVLGEVGYYLADPDALAEAVVASLTDDGVVAAVHWRRPAPGYPSTAEAVHAAFGRRLHSVASHIEADFVLDVWSVDGRSVAEETGVV